jgi:hypothetical protein
MPRACREYACANCGEVFHTPPDWSEADMLMEYQETFAEEERARGGELPVLICDDCYEAAKVACAMLKK